jgi:hypothetical protein
MCLFTIKKEEEEDIYVPARRVERYRREERYRTSSPHRSSSRVIVAQPPPAVVLPARPPSIRIPTPVGKVLPPPQPVPVFVEPAPTPEVHYVHVSPRSSISDDRSDYRYERREVRVERDYSPARSHRGSDYYEYRHVHGEPPRERRAPRRERSRSRSRSRVRHYDDEEDRTNVRISRKIYADERR